MNIRLSEAEQRQIDRIMAWDMTLPKKHLEREGYGREQVEEMEAEYKKYMSLYVVQPDGYFPMSAPVDPFWHSHILTTNHYHDFCEEAVGGYVHHLPALSEEDQAALQPDYQRNTLPTLERVFGKLNQKMWPVMQAVCKCCGNCARARERVL